jgi:D-glycero-alpha-D-manno-heptose-7-phosphate kinase
VNETAIRATARCRVDLGGGTLDIWPLGLLFPGAQTVNVAIDLRVEVTMARRQEGYRLTGDGQVVEAGSADDLAATPAGGLVGVAATALGLPPVEVTIRSDSPRGGGLGASSAVTVGLIAAGDRLLGRPPREAPAAARLARDLEAQLMRLPTGIQDHYPSLVGGALALQFGPGGEQVRQLSVDLAELGRHLLVVYSGQSHFSAATNWQIIRRCLEADPEVLGLLHGIAEVAGELPAALERADWEAVGDLVGREWQLRRHLAEGVSVPAIESLLQMARSLGAWGGKACGAGGGGCVALLVPPERRQVIARSLELAGGVVLATTPTASTLAVEELPAAVQSG